MERDSSDAFLKDLINIAKEHFDTIVSSDFNIVKENYRNVLSKFVTVLINKLDNYFESDNKHYLLNYYSNLFDDDRLYFIFENEKKYIFSLSGELDEEIKKTIKQIISPESKKNKYFSVKDFFENKKNPSNINKILNSVDISRLFYNEEIKEDYRLYKLLISSLDENSLELITLPLTNEVENKLIANLNIIVNDGFSSKNLKLLEEIQFNLNVIFSYIRSYDRLLEIKYHSMKSAIAAIQSRNESHNIGSHVISSLINGLFKPTDMQVLLKYLQERMDYSAQVCVDIPKWTVNTWLVSQLLKGFTKQNLLLNNIVKSEKIDRIGWDTDTFDIKLRIDSEKEEPFKSIFTELSDLEIQDLQLAIPGGITGNQAFYNILENIIRNIAKHGFSKAENKKYIVIFLDLKTGNNSNYQLYISDNLTIETADVCKKDFEERLYSGFIDESTGELVYKNWGTAEIKIGAGYLNQKEYTEIGGSDIKNEIEKYIKVVHLDVNKKAVTNNIQQDENNQNKFISYKISLPKPRKILIFDPEVEKNCFSNGFAILKELNGDENIAYDLVILKEQVDENIRKKLPYRVIEIKDIRKGDKDLFEALQSFDVEKSNIKIYNQLYYFWLNKKYFKTLNEKIVNLFIDLSGNSLKDKKHFNELQMLKFILKDPYFTDKGIIQKISSFIKRHEKELIYPDYLNFILKETNYDIQNKYKEYSALYSQIYDSQNTTEIQNGLTNDDICQLNNEIGAKIQLVNNCEDKKENTICFQRHAETDKEDKLYLEALSGSQSYFGRLSSLDENLVYGLVESALTKICIVDERVFDFQEQMDYKNTFNNLNIVVHRDCASLYNDDSICKTLDRYILIIHQSILSGKEEEILGENFVGIYTTSGRGTPEKKFAKDKNYDDIKFIPFANIQHALLKPYPEKYILVQNLFKI